MESRKNGTSKALGAPSDSIADNLRPHYCLLVRKLQAGEVLDFLTFCIVLRHYS